LVLDGDRPAKVPDRVIADLRSRERNGLVEVPPPPGFRRGDKVRIVRGPLSGLEGLVEGLRPQQRIEILLAVLGRVELAKRDIAPI
jgi:transcriptional antiterminator RfaH